MKTQPESNLKMISTDYLRYQFKRLRWRDLEIDKGGSAGIHRHSLWLDKGTTQEKDSLVVEWQHWNSSERKNKGFATPGSKVEAKKNTKKLKERQKRKKESSRTRETWKCVKKGWW